MSPRFCFGFAGQYSQSPVEESAFFASPSPVIKRLEVGGVRCSTREKMSGIPHGTTEIFVD